MSSTHLSAHHEALEALGEAWRRAMPLGEWAHDLRVVHDERRVYALRLDKLADQLVEQSRRCARRRAIDAVRHADGVELARCLCTRTQLTTLCGLLEYMYNIGISYLLCIIYCTYN